MLDTWARRLGLRTSPAIFFSAAIAMIIILLVLLIAPEWTQEVFADGRAWVVDRLGWFFILGVTAWLAFLLYVAFSRYGNIRLGRDADRPEYSNISWFTMLFAGGIGTVLMFWGVAEPIFHFSDPPRGEEPFSAAAANDAMSISLYHLGLHTWAIFALPGLAFAYFVYRHKLPLRVSSVFYPFLKDRIYGPIGKTIDVFAILGTLFGVAVSIGLGTSQINAGLSELFDGFPDSAAAKVGIIAVLTTVAVSSIVMGLDKGIKRLSNINIGMATALMVFVLLAGSTLFLAREIIETVGLYLTNIFELAFWNDSISTVEGDWGWQGGWTVFYWAWTVTWAPFIGIFVARISRGRTIREFVLGVLFAPSAFTLVWFAIFGWSAMEIDGIDGAGGAITEAVSEGGAPLAMFAFFENFPATELIQGIAVVIVAIFFATSSDSASLVVDMLCTGDSESGPVRQRVFWGVSEGMLAALLIVVAGDVGLTALQQVITVIGLPIFIMVFASLFALWAGLRNENLPKYVVPPPPGEAEELEAAPQPAGDAEERETAGT